MRKTERLSFGVRLAAATLVGLLSLAAHAQAQTAAASTAPVSSGVKSSIQTVDELIKIENAEVLAKSRPPVSPAAAMAAVKLAPVAPTIQVASIYGASGALRTDLTVNGQSFEGLRPGAPVGNCVVREIVNKCVALAPASRRTAKNMCPSACWTGEQAFAMDPVAGMPMGAPGAAGQPMPAPLPMGSVVPAPIAPLQPVAR